jgi:hypothetical protein
MIWFGKLQTVVEKEMEGIGVRDEGITVMDT